MFGIRALFSLALLSGCPDTKEDDAVKSDTAEPLPEGPYSFPLQTPDDFYQTVGVDHDPTVYDGIQMGICRNYDGRAFPWCYDEHDGSDYMLDGAFETMDAGSSDIIAAADGVVVDTEDGHYDRCHLVDMEVSCDGYDMLANYVILEHADGYRTRYWHMKNGSVAVAIGDAVKCGDYLGLVGSSGHSSAPHLHFQVENPDGENIDPYAGSYSQEESYWVNQGDPEGFPEQKCRN